MSKHSSHNGFTLVELLITVALIGIIAAIAVPSFRDIVISNSVSFGRDNFFQSLVYARSEAIKNGTAVSICKSTNGTSCDDSLDWDAGWLLFSDADRDAAIDTGDEVVRTQAGLDSEVTMSYTGGDRITFDSRGLTLAGDGTMTFGHSAGSQFDRTVDLGVTGRATKGK